jgi:RNA polymerase sigma-54 factor
MLQIQDQSLRQVATAHLAQTMSLLSLSNEELREKILEELSSNPALEMADDVVCPTCQAKLSRRGPCPKCSLPAEEENAVVFVSPREHSGNGSRGSGFEEDMDELEPAAPESLAIHVLQQLAAELEKPERPIAAYVLSSLDEEGFLTDPPALIARITRSPLAQVQRVIDLISHADPAGLATSGPRQALLAQLDLLQPGENLTRRMLETCFELLAEHDYEAISDRLGVSIGQVRAASNFIQDNLNPFPARAYWGSSRTAREADPNVFHAPDIQISQRSEGPLIVEIFSSLPGWLRVNPIFKQAMSQAEEDQSEAWKEHLERASLFVKCLQQRNNTMRVLMEELVARQKKFILRGDRHLRPMTRAKLADTIGVHESTVSRAVSNKGVALPDGRIIPLARFFDRSLSVRDRIKEIVSEETKPLTDDQIASALRKQGVKIARRTVAKYRAIEGILPARLRKARAIPA